MAIAHNHRHRRRVDRKARGITSTVNSAALRLHPHLRQDRSNSSCD